MDNLRGILWMVAAMAGFALEDVLIKAAAATLPVGQILVVLGVGGLVVFGGWCRLSGVPLWSADLGHPAVLLRNAAELLGTLCFVSAIVLLPLATVSAVFQAIPLVVTLGAALFLGEKVGLRRWSAIAVGLVGVLIVIRPGFAAFEPAALLAVASTVLLGTRDLATRRIPARIPSPQLAAYGFGAAGLAGVMLLPFGQPPVWPGPADALRLLGAVGFGVVGYYAITTAMRAGEVAVIAPFRYSRLLFAILLGFAVFGEVPDAATLVGAALILGSGLYTLLRERRLAARARVAPPAPHAARHTLSPPERSG